MESALLDSLNDMRGRFADDETVKKAFAPELYRLEQESKVKAAELNKKKEVFESGKRNLLKAKLSSYKALMGANGQNSTSASAGAVFRRLASETDEDIANNDFFLDLDLLLSRINFDDRKRKSLLDVGENDQYISFMKKSFSLAGLPSIF
jgi:hypothetical protein